MAKDTPANRQQMRHRIAHMAARMIAEDGIADYGLAKRKAARQAGAPDSRNLPTNVEIEEALRAYQDLYQGDEHPERVARLRELALDTMRMLDAFDARAGTNTTIPFDGLPYGAYRSLTFYIGLDSAHNVTGALPHTVDNENMAWPALMPTAFLAANAG